MPPSSRERGLWHCRCEPVRFKLDENLPEELAELLRQGGHDAQTVVDQGFGGASDTDIAAICRREGRTIITFDTDFADIREYPPSAHPGIVVLRLDSQARDHTLAIGARLLRAWTDQPLDGQLWIVDESRIRVRT